MCVQDSEQVTEGMENLGAGFALGDGGDGNDDYEICKTWSLQNSPLELCPAQNENWEKNASLDPVSLGSSFPVRIFVFSFIWVDVLFVFFFHCEISFSVGGLVLIFGVKFSFWAIILSLQFSFSAVLWNFFVHLFI